MQKELVRTSPDQLQGVERDARPDVTRSDILPRLIGLDFLLVSKPQRLPLLWKVASPQKVSTSHSLTLMTAVSWGGSTERDQTGRHLTLVRRTTQV
jgi:hypothetical protein